MGGFGFNLLSFNDQTRKYFVLTMRLLRTEKVLVHELWAKAGYSRFPQAGTLVRIFAIAQMRTTATSCCVLIRRSSANKKKDTQGVFFLLAEAKGVYTNTRFYCRQSFFGTAFALFVLFLA